MMRTFRRMSTASSAVTVLAVAAVCFFGNWKSQADAGDRPAPSAEERMSSHPASDRSPPQIVDEKPKRRDVRSSAKLTLNDEIRELRNDVKVLRRDVGRLIDILEERDSTSLKTAPPDDDHSSNMPEEANFKERWDITLEEVISIGLQNAKTIRDLGRVTPFGFDGKKKSVLCRVNKEVSLAEFEAAVRNLLSDAEGAYWELWAAHRNLDTARKSRDSAQTLWNEIYERVKGGMVHPQAEVQAREQYFCCRDQLESALKELYSREGKLRLVLGLASSDGRLMRAADEPMTEKYIVDWNDAKKVALSNSVELRQQRRVVEQAELELVAIKTSLQPQLDHLQTYRWYGAGGIDFLSPVLPTPGSRHAAAGVRHATLKVMREKARLEAMEQNFTHLLTSATRSIDFSYQSAKTHFNRSLEAESEVESTTMLYKSGKTTLDIVIDAQRRLAQSKIDHTSALAQHMTAIKDALFRQGSLLGKHNVVIEMPGQRIHD